MRRAAQIMILPSGQKKFFVWSRFSRGRALAVHIFFWYESGARAVKDRPITVLLRPASYTGVRLQVIFDVMGRR